MGYELRKIGSRSKEARSQTQEARKNLASCILPLVSCLLYLASCLLFTDSVDANECKLMEPEVLKRYIKDGTIYSMVLLDVRPKFEQNMRRIARAIPASIDTIEKELAGEVDELIGKNVILIGEDTKSAENVCSYMIKKTYGTRNIFVLKGGMEKWDGPVLDDISKVECEVITSRQLINMMKSNRKIEIVDKRPADEYYGGHIPEARLIEGSGKGQLSIKKNLKELERRKKWERENVTVVYVYDNEWHAMRECRYEKYWTWGYKNIYVLKGGMKTWEGEVKRDYLEILKKKAKEYIKGE